MGGDFIGPWVRRPERVFRVKMSNTNTDKVKVVPGMKGSVAVFVRPRDNRQIYVFTKRGESVEAAINRVKARNGASSVEHSLTN
jgi:hypothetical protein